MAVTYPFTCMRVRPLKSDLFNRSLDSSFSSSSLSLSLLIASPSPTQQHPAVSPWRTPQAQTAPCCKPAAQSPRFASLAFARADATRQGTTGHRRYERCTTAGLPGIRGVRAGVGCCKPDCPKNSCCNGSSNGALGAAWTLCQVVDERVAASCHV